MVVPDTRNEKESAKSSRKPRTVPTTLDEVPIDEYNCDGLTEVPFYNLPPLIGYQKHDATRPKAPAARILGRANNFGSFDESPGPGHYNTAGTTRFGPVTGRKAKILSRPRDLTSSDEVPGPGAYFPKTSLTVKRLPCPVLVGRVRDIAHTESTPGPGNYAPEPVIGLKLPRFPNSTAAVIKSRPKEVGFYDEKGPGPGAYTYDLNKIYKRTLSAPVGGRTKDIIGVPDGPAPNAYFPKTNSFKPRAPSFSFGNKPSRCMTVVIEETDNVYA